MIKEFVNYEMALALKELGFDEPCFYQYVRDYDECGELIPIVSETNYPILRNNTEVSDFSGGDCFAAPTFSQAFRFFRDKYNLEVAPYRLNFKWVSLIFNIETSTYCVSPELFEKYEEAEINSLQKMIEIIKNK